MEQFIDEECVMIMNRDILNLWIDRAVEIFRRFMPECDAAYPEIYILDEDNYVSGREKLLEELQSDQLGKGLPPESDMELIHGSNGDAIIIREALLRDFPKLSEFGFQHMLWHELGHYYAINNECAESDLHRLNDQDCDEDPTMQEGYWMWAEFIAESISCYVDYMHCTVDNAEFYHPEQIRWEPELWAQLYERLQTMLEDNFYTPGMSMDTYNLAHYFATLLMDDATKRFIQAADSGELKVYDDDGGKRIAEPGEFDATAIWEFEEEYHETLWEMKDFLEKQMGKERFWEINENFLERLGTMIDRLNDERLMIALTMAKEDGVELDFGDMVSKEPVAFNIEDLPF